MSWSIHGLTVWIRKLFYSFFFGICMFYNMVKVGNANLIRKIYWRSYRHVMIDKTRKINQNLKFTNLRSSYEMKISIVRFKKLFHTLTRFLTNTRMSIYESSSWISFGPPDIWQVISTSGNEMEIQLNFRKMLKTYALVQKNVWRK